MEQRHLGRSGLQVSRLALGTMTWGRDTDEHEAEDQLRAFVEAGGNLVDTAAAYGDGASEGVLGGLLADVFPRDEIMVATKAGVTGADDAPDTSRRALLTTLDASLDRLGTDHVDLWQVHLWSDATPIEEVLSTLDHAVSSGRARYVGVSNFSGWQTALGSGVAARLAGTRATGLHAGRVLAGPTRAEREVKPAARAAGMGLLAWSPLGPRSAHRQVPQRHPRRLSPRHAALRGLRPNPPRRTVSRASPTRWSPRPTASVWRRSRSRWPGYATSRASIAPIVGARTAGQLLGSLQAEELTLPAEIMAALDDVSSDDVDALLEPQPAS